MENKAEGGHLFTPWVKRNVEVSSDRDELKERVKLVFLEKLKGLLSVEGELLQKWENKLDLVCDEITKLKLLKSRNNLVYNVIMKNKEGFEKERDLIRKRIKEFRGGIECVIQHLEEKGFKEEEEGLRVFKIGREFDWNKIHCLMMRECRRLDVCLPIFAFRQQILRQIHYQQVPNLFMFLFSLEFKFYALIV